MSYCCINGHSNPSNLNNPWCVGCESLVSGAVIDDYRVVSFVGKGSYGAVYRAQQQSLNNRSVVIKVLQSTWAQSYIAEFRQEAALLASVSHPYILPVYAYGMIHTRGKTASGYVPYLVLPYAEYGSLADLYAKEGPLPLWRVVTFVEEVADALAFAHERGVLHRDVKPANILLMGAHVMLADFGVASLISAETSHLNVSWAGSPAFIAPEVWNFCPGRYSDQYALAVTCFQLLTGRFPWQDYGQAGSRDWTYIHRSVAPTVLREYRADIPEAIDIVVQKALAKDPHERYSSVKDFATDLREAMQNDTQEVAIPLPVLVRTAEQVMTVNNRDHGSYGNYGQKQQAIRMAEVRLQHTAEFVPAAEVHIEPVEAKRKYAASDNEWIWGGFALNMLICLLLGLQVRISTRELTSVANLLLTLWPALLIGPIVASFFRALPLYSAVWGICWGLLFGVLDTLFSALFCWTWTAIALTIPHWNRDWQYPGDGWHIFWRQVLWLQPSALSLLIIGVWLAVIGGMYIGYLNARRAVAMLPVHS
ncbi:MAG: serine/threonine protein kinase [Ktedonobacteraceae bacterium]